MQNPNSYHHRHEQNEQTRQTNALPGNDNKQQRGMPGDDGNSNSQNQFGQQQYPPMKGISPKPASMTLGSPSNTATRYEGTLSPQTRNLRQSPGPQAQLLGALPQATSPAPSGNTNSPGPENLLQQSRGSQRTLHQNNSSQLVRKNSARRPHNFDDFTIVTELSSGAFGRIILASLRATQELFIIKRVPYVNPDKKKQADDEVALLKLAQSKYTVRLIEQFVDRIDLCIVMEYCTGGNLRQFIDKMKTWSSRDRKIRTYRFVFQILSALDHLHSLGIIHRDMKPENVFVDKDGNAKTGDYGLAQKLQDKTYLRAAGTRIYAPPEAHRQNKMTTASDIYSVGVIALEMLTARHPFEGKTIDETINNIVKGKMWPLPDYINKDFQQMIMDMLDLNPANRPTAKDLLETDLMQLQLENDLSYKRGLEQGNEAQKSAEEQLKNSQQAMHEAEQGKRVAENKLCGVISATLDGRECDDARLRVIGLGIVEGLQLIFATYPLDRITRVHSMSYFDLTGPCGTEVIQQLYAKKPFGPLLRLLQHNDGDVVGDAIGSIYNILIAGTKTTLESSLHPHFEAIESCGGVERMFAAFRRGQNKNVKDTAALCIGQLYRARECSNKIILHETILHLIQLTKDAKIIWSNSAKLRMRGLAANNVNLAEIEGCGFNIQDGCNL